MIPNYQNPNQQERKPQFREYTDISYTPPKAEDVRWAFNYDIFILQLRAKLMGGWLIEDKQIGYKIQLPADSKPLMNTEGIDQTIAFVNGFVDGRIQGLTVYNEERILKICQDLHRRLTDFYFIKMEQFNLTPETAKVIIAMIMNLFESNLRKSLEGRTLKMLGESERIVTTKDESKRKWLPF